jgi:hypothetical protein
VSARPVNCVDVEPDYPAKKIVITIRIDFYLLRIRVEDRRSTPEERQRAKEIADGIVRDWNGHKFKCFDVVLVLDWRFVESRERFRDNALDVALRTEPGHRSHVLRAGDGAGRLLSDAPDDRFVPGTVKGPRPLDTQGGSVWSLWKTPAQTYAHEVGHILGLDDGYRDDGTRVPDHPKDIMWSSWQGHIMPETITKLIRRSGKVDESKVRCPLTLDMGPMDWNFIVISLRAIQVHAWACDYDPPSSDPSRPPRPMQFQGVIDYWGEVHMQIGDPLGLGAEGRAHYGVNFELRVPGNLEIQGQGIRFFGADVRWSTHLASGVEELPYLESGVMDLVGLEGDRLSTEACWPGPKLVPVFRHGAPECPG